MTSKATAVFSIVELLDMILLELPIQDLLLAQRVNREFRDTIITSPRIQERLLMRPRSRRNHNGTSLLNPFLAKITKSEPYPSWVGVTSEFGMIQDPNSNDPNPVLGYDDHHKSRLATTYEIQPGKMVTPCLFPRFTTRTPAPHESWTKMLVADPPCKFGYLISIFPAGICVSRYCMTSRMVEVVEIANDLRSWGEKTRLSDEEREAIMDRTIGAGTD